MEKLKRIIWPLLIAATFAIVFYSQFDPKLHVSGDNASYIKLAENMVDGHGYSMKNIHGEYAPASHFPPGYSTILALFMALGINSLVFFKVLNGIFLLASILIVWYLVGKLTGNKLLASCSAMVAVFSPQTLNFAMIVMSEMSFMFFITLVFLCIYKYSNQRDRAFYLNVWFWLALVFIVIGYYIRSVGMAAMIAILVFFAFRKEWKQPLTAIGIFILLLLPWSLRNSAYGIESRYFGTIMTVNPWRPELGTISSFGEMIEKMLKNFDETVIKGFKEILFPFIEIDQSTPSNFIGVVLGIMVVAVVFWGAWNMGKLRWLFITYLLGNIGLFMLWHGGNGSRYVTPIAPILFVCFYAGVYFLIERIVTRKGENALVSKLPYAFLLMILPALTPLKAQAEQARQPYYPAYANYFQIAGQMDKAVPEGTVVIARKPELFGYYAKKVIPVNYIYSQSEEEVIADMVKKNADYVVLEQLGYGSTGRYLYPAIDKYPELFQIAWHLSNPDTYLLLFDRKNALKVIASDNKTAED